LVSEVELAAEMMSTAERGEKVAYSLVETWAFWRVAAVVSAFV
jgi:hypothetical protein